MKLIILNYNTGDVDIIRYLPDDIDNLSFFIETTLGYNEDEIAWMTGNDDTVINIATWDNGQLINEGWGSLDCAI